MKPGVLPGITYGSARGMSLVEAGSYGVDTGRGNALTLGAAVFSMDDFRESLAQVTVESTF